MSNSEQLRPDAVDGSVRGERGAAAINRHYSTESKASTVLAVGLMSALGLGILTWYYAGAMARGNHAGQTAQAVSVRAAQTEVALPSLGRIDPPAPWRPDVSAPELPLRPQAAALPYGRAGPVGSTPPEKTPIQIEEERRLSGAAFARTSGEAGYGAATPAAGAPGADGDDLGAGTDLGVARLLHPQVTTAVRANYLPTQRLLLPKGAFIDCTLETAIDSTLPGMTTCIVATDTFSADGKVVLMERGTKLVGETRGQVQQGAARIFVLWTEARTPAGVVISLASPGTDELGRSGLPGKVNRHFFERFGAAILISAIEGAVQSASRSSSASGTVIYNPSIAQDVMTEVLKGTINIPPTVVKHQGDRIQVLVARDLDFRSVYELQAVGPYP